MQVATPKLDAIVKKFKAKNVIVEVKVKELPSKAIFSHEISATARSGPYKNYSIATGYVTRDGKENLMVNRRMVARLNKGEV